jgi:hypothetical protein
MGHAGAIVGGAEDTAAAKIAVFKECGIEVAVDAQRHGRRPPPLREGQGRDAQLIDLPARPFVALAFFTSPAWILGPTKPRRLCSTAAW